MSLINTKKTTTPESLYKSLRGQLNLPNSAKVIPFMAMGQVKKDS